MKLLNIQKVTSDAVVPNTSFCIDVSTTLKVVTAATTSVLTFNAAGAALATVTFTVDGADTAEKLLNAQKITTYLNALIAQLNGPVGNSKKAFELITSIEDFHRITGIVKTGGTGLLNDALVTTAVG